MSMIRKELTFASCHDTCAAWFYPAAADKGARPIIVMAHGLTGTTKAASELTRVDLPA